MSVPVLAAVPDLAGIPAADVTPLSRARRSPPRPPVDENALLRLLQQVVEAAATRLTAVDWAGVVVALDAEPYVAACTCVARTSPGAAGSAPAHGGPLLSTTPVLVAGRVGGSLLLGGGGTPDATAVGVAGDLAQALGRILTSAVVRGRRIVADEIRFAILARTAAGSDDLWVRHQGLEPRTR